MDQQKLVYWNSVQREFISLSRTQNTRSCTSYSDSLCNLMSFKAALNVVKLLSEKPSSFQPRLVSIGFSHFCEKSRWALDLSPMDYYEEIHCPGLHWSSTLHLANLPRIRPWKDEHFDNVLKTQFDDKTTRRKDKTAVPKLVLPHNYMRTYNIGEGTSVVANGSSGISKFLSVQYPHAMGHLYPGGATSTEPSLADRVIDLESYLDTTLGPAVTKWAFGNLLLTGPDFLATANSAASDVDSTYNQLSSQLFIKKATSLTQIPLIERLVVSAFGSGNLSRMIHANDISAAGREAALATIKQVFSKMDSVLAEATARHHQPSSSTCRDVFLFNTDKPTAADIAFSALCMPVLIPPECESLFASPAELAAMDPLRAPGCARLLQTREELLAAHPSARYALWLYRNHRFPACSQQTEGQHTTTAATADVAVNANAQPRLVRPKMRRM